jgi:hypothetical protein
VDPVGAGAASLPRYRHPLLRYKLSVAGLTQPSAVMGRKGLVLGFV